MKTLLLGLALALSSLVSSAASEGRELANVDGQSYPVYRYVFEVKPTSRSNPVYPKKARDEGRGGETLVGAIVNEKGRVVRAFVDKATGAADIQEAARAAVAQWKFPKLEKGGAPISYLVYVPIAMNPN
jgi:TonB family protein